MAWELRQLPGQGPGGSVGAGLIARIVRGYTFISRNYVQGDAVYIIGFSRGAYTARALAGMIAAKGLLDATKIDLTDKESAYRLGAAVWVAYRKVALRSSTGWFARLRRQCSTCRLFCPRRHATIC